ncbi:N-acetylmuramoyl-L-alanine amidase, partial [Amylibacter sp.]|nr:N-acetylmuramoyl-L-alanine amidase [Amylibacter sp.]
MIDALKIFQNPSPNFGNRRGFVTPNMVVLHYTAMKSSDDAIARMSDPKSEVSAHYLIDKFGKIIQLVDEQKRAWHAGRGCWGEINDVNSHSIGIELDYYPSIDESFDKRQLCSLNNLLFDILKRRPEIIPKSIIGHSDMAPE